MTLTRQPWSTPSVLQYPTWTTQLILSKLPGTCHTTLEVDLPWPSQLSYGKKNAEKATALRNAQLYHNMWLWACGAAFAWQRKKYSPRIYSEYAFRANTPKALVLQAWTVQILCRQQKHAWVFNPISLPISEKQMGIWAKAVLANPRRPQSAYHHGQTWPIITNLRHHCCLHRRRLRLVSIMIHWLPWPGCGSAWQYTYTGRTKVALVGLPTVNIFFCTPFPRRILAWSFVVPR